MMSRVLQLIENQYFEWLCSIVCERRFSKEISYKKLLMYLHKTEFRYLIPNDQNRAEDGIDLRYRFVITCDCDYSSDILDGPCSVLEMMVALAIRCEENIMDDPSFGNRTGQWFWGMINNLGLGSMTDNRFDRRLVENTVERFLNVTIDPTEKAVYLRYETAIMICEMLRYGINSTGIWTR